MSHNKKAISIVTPCYQEEGNVKACYEEVKRIFESELPNYNYEHIFCDNSSTDGTLVILREIAGNDNRVKIIVNSRNFGGPNSMFNGMLAATGDAVIPLVPADLQDPPALIPEFVKLWEQGYDIVYGVRSNREESSLMHAIRKFYYSLVNRFANINIPLNVGDFTLIDKKVQNILRQYDDHSPYLRGMIANCGFKSVLVPYTWKARKWGKSNFKLYNLIDVGLNGLISFTNIPMRMCMLAGFFLAAISITYALVGFISSLVAGSSPKGIPTLIVALFFFSGINLFFLGVLGEYISAIHFQVRKRPLVVEQERVNF